MPKAEASRKYLSCFIALMGVIAVCAILFTVAFWNLGRFLDVTQTALSADAILVMGGEGGRYQRTEQALQLYDEGVAPIVIFSGGTLLGSGLDCTSTEMSLDAAMQLGLPEEAIIIADQAQSTLDEAANVAALAADNDWHTVVFVTDIFHTRRSLATMEHVTPQIHWIASAPDDTRYNPDRWWTTEDGLVFAVNEALKLAFYWKNYRISPFIGTYQSNEY